VLEHLGRQGDYRLFFETFSEAWRILKPGGFLCATVPGRKSLWVWSDPGHTRVIFPPTLLFLDQHNYATQEGRTTMSDYRRVYQADFETIFSHDNGETHQFILQAVKPSRCAIK
jgi:SAM-dependent methyltransferase